MQYAAVIEKAENDTELYGLDLSRPGARAVTIDKELVKQPAALPDSGVGWCPLLAYLSDTSLGFSAVRLALGRLATVLSQPQSRTSATSGH